MPPARALASLHLASGRVVSGGLARVLTLGLMASALAGCAEEPRTCELATSELVMFVTVTDLDGVVKLELELEAAEGDGTLELCPGRDELKINDVDAEQIRAFGDFYYELELPSDQTSHIVELTRAKHEDVSVEVELPPPFEIEAPVPEATASRAEILEVRWSPSWADHEMDISIVDGIGSSCIEGLGFDDTVVDLGEHPVPAGSLVGGPGDPSCEVELNLSRSLELAYPPELHEGGGLRAFVIRTQVLRSVQ